MPREFQNKGKIEHLVSENFAIPQVTCENFATPKSTCKNFPTPNATCKNFRNPLFDLRKFRKGCQQFHNPFLPCETHAKFKKPLCEKPTVRRKTKGHLKILFKNLHGLYLFRTTHLLLRKAQCHLTKQFSLRSTPRDHQFEEATSTSRPILAMARIKGGHTDPSASREARPSASAPQDSSQASQALTIPSFEGRVPSSPPQHRYLTQRPPNSPPPNPSVHFIPPKRARTSGPRETFRHSQPKPQAPADSQHPSGIALEAIIKRPMVTVPPIKGNSNCRAKPFHYELYFDIEAMRQQPDLRDSFRLLQRYHLKGLMTPREFFYPRVAMDFYQSMTTQDAQSPTAIHFSIDGCQGILEAKHIAEAPHIPFQPEDPTHFRQWSPIPQ